METLVQIVYKHLCFIELAFPYLFKVIDFHEVKKIFLKDTVLGKQGWDQYCFPPSIPKKTTRGKAVEIYLTLDYLNDSLDKFYDTKKTFEELGKRKARADEPTIGGADNVKSSALDSAAQRPSHKERSEDDLSVPSDIRTTAPLPESSSSSKPAKGK